MFAFLAGHRRRVFPDGLFADLFPSTTGRPSIPADVIASVLVLQILHHLFHLRIAGLNLRRLLNLGLTRTGQGSALA